MGSNNPFLNLPKSGHLKQPDPSGSNEETQEEPTKIEDNPFLNLPKMTHGDMYRAVQAGSPPQGSPVYNQPRQSTFMDGVEAMNRQFGRMAEGGLQLLFKAVGSDTLQQKLAQHHEKQEQSYQEAQERSPTATTVGSVVGALGSSIAYGGPAAGAGASLASKVAAGSLGGAYQAFLQYSPTEEQRAKTTATAGAAGGAISGAMGIAPKLAAGLYRGVSTLVPGGDMGKYLQRVFRPEKQAAKELAYNVQTQIGDDLSKLQKTDVPLTPAEELGGHILPSKEKAALLADPEKRLVQRAVVQKETAALKKLDDAFADMTPEGYEQAKKLASEAYEKVNRVNLPDESIQRIKANNTLQEIIQTINKGDEAKIRALPDTALTKLDKVKQFIDEKLYRNSKAQPADKMSGIELRRLREAEKTLKDEIMQYPEYQDALKYATQYKTVDKYTALLGKKAEKAGASQQLDVNQTYTTLFGTPEKRADFLADVAKTGGNTEQAEQTIQLLDKLRNSPLIKLLSKEQASLAEIQASGGLRGVVRDFLNKASVDRFNKAVLKLTLSGNKWKEEVANIIKMSDKGDAKMEATLKLLSKLMPATERAAAVQAAKISVDADKELD